MYKFCWRKASGAHPPIYVTNLPHSACCCQQSEKNTLGRAEGTSEENHPLWGLSKLSSAVATVPLSQFFLAVLPLKGLLPLSVWRPRDRTSQVSLTFGDAQNRWWMESSKTTPHDAHFLRLTTSSYSKTTRYGGCEITDSL